jgi:hypothetical protein
MTGKKPTQAQFWAWMDSFWHKDEVISLRTRYKACLPRLTLRQIRHRQTRMRLTLMRITLMPALPLKPMQSTRTR